MYMLDGLEYRLKLYGIFFLTAGLLCVIISKFWRFNKNDKSKYQKKGSFDKKTLILGIVCFIISISSSGYYFYKIQNPEISVYEGVFIEEHRKGRNINLFNIKFTFDGGENPNPSFELDAFSKKKIYNEDFEKTSKHKIFYEDDTNIIVKVEKAKANK